MGPFPKIYDAYGLKFSLFPHLLNGKFMVQEKGCQYVTDEFEDGGLMHILEKPTSCIKYHSDDACFLIFIFFQSRYMMEFFMKIL